MEESSTFKLPPKSGNPYWPMPLAYGKAGKDIQKAMRLALMRGWYDENKPDTLMTDKEVFLAALYFWVEYYNKKAQNIRHLYPLPDTRHKVRMQEMFTHPRSALVAPRGEGKTFTVIFELAPFLAIARPHTSILIGSETQDMTKEKLKEIRKRVEPNGLILRDFGMVYPRGRSGRHDWNNDCLDFLNGSSIRGSSIDSATRGRHPLVGLIDDPEGKKSKNRSWRESFMEWLFNDYMNQFADKGTHVMWIGTILRTDSCLWRAIHNDDEENRFAGWKRHILKKVYEDPPGSGNMVTSWPERLSIEEFERKKQGGDNEDGSVTPIGLAAVMAEFQGEPIPVGEKMFHREERRHGYVIYEVGKKKMLYDPATMQHHDLEKLRERCYACAGVDIADTPSKLADSSAIVIALLDPDGVFWFVDAWEGKVFSDKATAQAFTMAHDWKVGNMGWEAVTLGKRIFREAHKLRQERAKAGFHVPRLFPLKTDGIPKPLRIERLRVPFDMGRIKLPLFRGIDGLKFYKHPRRFALQHLVDQFDVQTGEETDDDDLLDAAEMMHRASGARPKNRPPTSESTRLLESWEKQGVIADPMDVQPKYWTERMKREFNNRVRPGQKRKGGVLDAFL